MEEKMKMYDEIAKMKNEQMLVEKKIESKQKEMENVWKNEQKRIVQQDVENIKHFKTFMHKMQLHEEGRTSLVI